jgi:hypothetical protein
LSGRVKVQTHEVAHLLHKKRVGRELKTLAAVRLQSEQCEIPAHRAFGNAGGGSGRAHAPVSGVLGLVLYYQLNQLRHLFVIVSAGAPWPQFIVQTGESALLIAPAPVANGRSTHPAAPRHFPIGLSVARPQYDAGAPHQRMRYAARAHHRLQLQTVGLVNHQRLTG